MAMTDLALRLEFAEIEDDGTAYATDFMREKNGLLPSSGSILRLQLVGDQTQKHSSPFSLKNLLRTQVTLADAADVHIRAIGFETMSFCHSGWRGTLGELLVKGRNQVESTRGGYPAHLQPRFDTFHTRMTLLLEGRDAELLADAGGEVVELVIEDPSGLSSFSDEERWLKQSSTRFERRDAKRSWSALTDLGLTAALEVEQPITELSDIADLVRKATRIVALTGAGISVDSGIPPFRSSGSETVAEGATVPIWHSFDPELMSLQRFNAFDASQPEDAPMNVGARAWWAMKRSLWPKFKAAAPNPAHRFFQKLAEAGRLSTIVTQNIDSLHGLATSPAAVGMRCIELHGHMRSVVCSDYPSTLNPVPYRSGSCNYVTADVDAHMDENSSGVPRCPRPGCGAPLRSETVMFGQPMPTAALEDAKMAIGEADLLFVVGTSLVVKPASELPGIAVANGVPIIIVNKHETQYDPFATALVDDGAAAFFAALTAEVFNTPST
jgi:NAD-dependent deacetylase